MDFIGITGHARLVAVAPPTPATAQVAHVHHLPPGVRSALPHPMAEAGTPYQAADIVTESRLPTIRFVHASREGTVWTVEYERGGIGYSYHRAVVRLVDGQYVATVERLRKGTP